MDIEKMIKDDVVRKAYDSDDYYVSREGKLYRRDGYEKGTQLVAKKKLYFVNYKSSSKQKAVKYSLHLVIAEAFLEEHAYKIDGKVIKFKDGNKLNIHADNLYWDNDMDKSKMRVALRYKDHDKEIVLRESDIVSGDLINEWVKEGTMKAMPNTPKHYIHKAGFVISPNNRIRVSFISDTGYARLSKVPSIRHSNGPKLKKVNLTLHLLVVEHFLEPFTYSNKGKTVDHIDNNKLNNDVSNLEWVTQKVNINRIHDAGGVDGDAAVIITDLKLGKDFTMRSLREASRYLNLDLKTTMRRIAISQKYPIFHRFKLALVNPDKFFSQHKYGSTMLYVYDHVGGEKVTLNSKSKLSAKYGLSSSIAMSRLDKENVIYIGGCSISHEEDFIPFKVSKEQAVRDRDALWSQPIFNGTKT